MHLLSLSLAAMLTVLAVPARAAEALYFPPAQAEWERITPEKAGWDAAKVQAALDLAGKRNSSGVVILHRGRIMAEQYWNPADKAAKAKGTDYSRVVVGKDKAGHAIEDVASIQKSVSAMLVGIAQHKGLLKIEDPADKYLGKGWSKATPEQEKEITIRHLITMTSGLADDLTFEAAAGTRWRYNTAAYSHTVKVLAAVTKKEPNDFTGEWLTGRIGMSDSKWVPRGAAGGQDRINSLGFGTTARDLARFGLLVLAEGQWNGATVIADKDYLHAALKPSQKLNPSYGYLWWLNGQPEVARGAGQKVKGPLIRSAPSDLVAGLGAVDRKLFVVPSLQLVVTRLGASTGQGFDNEFWKALMEAKAAK